MTESGIKIELHLIQNFAPSNLNRDDTGQPKSAYFGGFRRARISSQCTKRSARMWWKERCEDMVGYRTKRLQELLFQELVGNNPPLQPGQDEEFLKQGISVFTDAYYAEEKDPQKTEVLVFIGPEEIKVCAKEIRRIWQDIAKVVVARRKASSKKKSKEDTPAEDNEESGGKEKQPKLTKDDATEDAIRQANLTADIALFGRMLADQPARNTEAACQVAHPISTHKVDMEMDYFTALDDLNPQEEPGASMLGEIGFNSACFYRYAVVDRDQLAGNLARKTARENGKRKQELTADDYAEADKVIKAFLEAMVYAIPTGKQHSFAAHNLPSFGLFVRRQGGVPVSLANAFARPVRPTSSDDDLIGLSVARLAEHWVELRKAYGEQGEKKTACFVVDVDKDRLGKLGESCKERVEQAIAEVISG